MPDLSRLSPRTICDPSDVERTPSVVLHPSPQCVQTVATWFISHGRVLYRYVPLVSAPTGQMSMHMPHCSQSRCGRLSGVSCAGTLGTMMDDEPRFSTASAKTSMPSPQ